MKHEPTQHTDGYERSDAQTRPLIAFGVALGVLIAVSLIVSAWLDTGLTPSYEATVPIAKSYDAREAPLDPSWPVLQANPYDDFEGHRASIEQLLTSYEWIDHQTGIARIPIDRAIAIYLEREGAAPEEGDR